ncbi:MAG: glycosyltransferase family 2 protein [Rhizobiales bacterium]|nr:glycosyltransferase family 2 protein [Hyphomicrobiales bacterium]
MVLALSVFIIARDEADRIGDAIASVIDIAEEVIVVDSGSTDATVAVARAAGARVIHHDFEGFGPQKRFAETQCRNHWLLNIDADEPLTHEAREEIRMLVSSGRLADFDCWRIPIRTVYPHEDKPAAWAFTYNQIRLYDRERAGFAASTVHDSVLPEPGARIGQIEGAIAHRSHRSINFQVEKFNRYAEMQVDDMIARGRRLSRLRLVTEFPVAFLKAYFIRRQCLYGLWGFSLAISYAYSRFLRIAKFHETELKRQAAEKRAKS